MDMKWYKNCLTIGNMKKSYLLLFGFLCLVGCVSNGKALDTQNYPEQTAVSAKNEIGPTSGGETVRETERGKLSPTLELSPQEKSSQFYLSVDQSPIVKREEIFLDNDDIEPLIGSTDIQNFDIPIVFNDAVKYYIRYFTNEKRKVFTNWLRRSRRYVPIITDILRKNGMPEDLVYLAMIESGFNPKAYSPAKACGPWQFIYETGGRYGLKVNRWVDERRDPEKSTVAAAKYLGDLFNQFGNWYLAAAGYNAGEKRVERAIEKHNTNDFWELYKYNTLPRETKNYIPQLIAAAVIAKEPEKYGFGSIILEEPIRFTEINVPPATSLTTIARASLLDVAVVRSYNPELLRGITPPGKDDYEIKLPYPIDTFRFSERLESILDSEPKIRSVISYKVKKRDTLSKIAKKYGVSSDDILLVNDCEKKLRLKSGMVIAVPRFTGPSKVIVAAKDLGKDNTKPTLAEKKRVTIVKENTRAKQAKSKTHHVVKKGETLTSISDKYGVAINDLKSFNKLKNGKIYPNMKLRLAGHVEKKSKTKIRFHVVKKGETLTSISDKYGVDIKAIKSANRLKSNKIQARMRLKIVTGEG